MTLYAHGVPQVAPPLVGVHLLWNGPRAWVYSPAGFRIQRRPARRSPSDCLTLTAAELATLRARHELSIRFGVLTERNAGCPGAVAPPGPILIAPASTTHPQPVCEVITLELDRPQPYVRVLAQAGASWAFALRDGKAVAGNGPLAGTAAHDLWAQGIDTVLVYSQALSSLGYCIQRGAEEDAWRDVPTIAHVQLPLRELMANLANSDDEFAEAQSRLLPGETLDRDEFETLAETVRRVVQAARPPRPVDLALLTRDTVDDEFIEMVAVDPIAALLPHPKWRRVLGFAYFDSDRTLVPGESYQYRISGEWPGSDLADRVYGFHTAPAKTPIPREIYLHDLRLRLPGPTTVGFSNAPADLTAITRRGIPIAGERPPFWLGPDLEGWSAVVDFPFAVKSVILELGSGSHSLAFTAGAGWATPGIAAPVPAGDRPQLDFANPVHQLRLAGEGFLCAIRIPAVPPGPVTLTTASAVLPPLVLADAPLPAPPTVATIANLQQPTIVASTTNVSVSPPPMHAMGFEVRWMPALAPGALSWPAGLPPPPTEATLFQVEHSLAGGAPTAWTPLLSDENYMTGHRDAEATPAELTVGGDLMRAFPEFRAPASGSVSIFWRDVFDFEVDGVAPRRPLPPPGTFHRYRVRAVDAVGRASPTWRETGELRLEKWIPPPQPPGPVDAKADELARPAFTGVHARILVQDAPDLTNADRALLGSHSNAIVLNWGWHANQREQDPFAHEFRVYATKRRLDGARGVLGSVADLGNGHYGASITLDEAVAADAAGGLRLDAGYPFEILTHSGGPGGTPLAITLIARVPQGGAFPVPADGPVFLPLKITPDRTRAPGWGPRVEIQPVTAGTVYRSAPIFDLLSLSADHPRDEALVGVSVADAQDYVPDPLADNRPGNESAIVAVPVQGRWHGRPVVIDVPALADVPVMVMPEPDVRPMRIDLDLTPILAESGLTGTERVRPERVGVDEVFRAYRIEGSRIMARVLPPAEPGDVEQEVLVPNASDRAAVLAALSGSELAAFTDRHAAFLAASHPFKARLFTPTQDDPVALPRFAETFPNKSQRYVYRLRIADAAGHLSADGITLKGIVRVPSTTRVPPPRREPLRDGDPLDRLRLAVDGSDEITHVLVFRTRIPAGERVDARAELLRVPSATRLAAGEGVRVRLFDGSLLTATVKALSDPDVEGSQPSRHVAIDIGANLGEKYRFWAVAVTRDGVASTLSGPWSLAMPLPPLPPAALALAGTAPNLTLTWTWTDPANTSEVVVESAAAHTGLWSRISPRLRRDVVSFAVSDAAPAQRYRLRSISIDGRTVLSNEVTA